MLLAETSGLVRDELRSKCSGPREPLMRVRPFCIAKLRGGFCPKRSVIAKFQFVAASHSETASSNRVGCKKCPFCSAKLDVFVRCTLNVLASMSLFTGISFQLQEFFRFQEKLILIARWLA